MDLILWRHAEAEDGAPDDARRLTAKGERQAKRVAKWLAKRLPEDALLISSPAVRARQTASALRDEFETSPSAAVGSGARALLAAAGWPSPERRTVVLVGHQPTLGEAAALALGGSVQPWSLKKGALVWLAQRSRGGKTETVLRAAISPDLV